MMHTYDFSQLLTSFYGLPKYNIPGQGHTTPKYEARDFVSLYCVINMKIVACISIARVSVLSCLFSKAHICQK